MTDAASAETLSILARLVAFDTTSALSNRGLIDHVADHLRGHGIAAEILPSPDGAKASLWATIGPRGGLVHILADRQVSADKPA